MCYRGLLVFLPLFCIGIALELPANFPKCKRSDSDLNGCLKKAIEVSLPKLENGIPELNFPSVQPLNISSLVIGEGKGAVYVIQNFTNIKLYNLFHPKIEAVDAKITDTGFDLTIDTLHESVVADAEYDFNGRVLVLPLVGQGPCKIILENMKIPLTMHGEKIEKKGQSYYEIKDFKIEMKPGKIIFNFENLFNGDKRLGDEMNKVLNDYWKEIWDDVSFAYEEANGLIFSKLAKRIFKKIPHEQIFLQ